MFWFVSFLLLAIALFVQLAIFGSVASSAEEWAPRAMGILVWTVIITILLMMGTAEKAFPSPVYQELGNDHYND